MMNMLPPLPVWSAIGLNDSLADEISAGMYSTTSSLATCCSSEKRWSPSRCRMASTIESRFWREDVVRMNDLERNDNLGVRLWAFTQGLRKVISLATPFKFKLLDTFKDESCARDQHPKSTLKRKSTQSSPCAHVWFFKLLREASLLNDGGCCRRSCCCRYCQLGLDRRRRRQRRQEVDRLPHHRRLFDNGQRLWRQEDGGLRRDGMRTQVLRRDDDPTRLVINLQKNHSVKIDLFKKFLESPRANFTPWPVNQTKKSFQLTNTKWMIGLMLEHFADQDGTKFLS